MCDTVNPNNISRYKMREQAFIVSFEMLFCDDDIDEIADNAIDSEDIYLSDYAINCAKGIKEYSETIDGYIEKNLKQGWKISRISKASYAILRLAIYEILYLSDIPTSVSINEAVELSKKYAADGDSAFINGVLGSIAKEIE
ncbi:MAG: transcription antitermination factor NusB [Oscillospiraceae bacterium]|nr:transcription antitermination factor NusB [Candidatus Ruminococcus equi]